MEYTINGVIELSPVSELRLSSGVNFITPLKASVVLSSKSDNELSVLIKLEADNDTTAQELAQHELNRICDLMSFYDNISISKCKIKTGKVILSDSCNANVNYGSNHVVKLVSYLGKDYSTDCEEAIYMWREAISNQSSILRYILLYRLLEFLKGDPKELTPWIMKEEPQVQIFKDRTRGDHTIYTYLRDNIHPKEKTFPMKQILDNESKLKTLVRKAFKEKFSI